MIKLLFWKFNYNEFNSIYLNNKCLLIFIIKYVFLYFFIKVVLVFCVLYGCFFVFLCYFLGLNDNDGGFYNINGVEIEWYDVIIVYVVCRINVDFI